MARFLIGTIAVAGHVNPCLPIAKKLVESGHEVWWYTGKIFQSKVEKTGAKYVPISTGLDFSAPETIPESLSKKSSSLKGLAQLKFGLKHFFIDSAVVQLKDCTKILQEFPADVFLCDLCFLGASWVHQQGGPPWAVVGISVLPFSSRDTAPFGLGIQPDVSSFGNLRNICLNWIFKRILFADVISYLDRVRESIKLKPEGKNFGDASSSPFLYLQPTVSEFEYPRKDLPETVHFIGPLLLDRSTDFLPPAWWDDLKDNKPVIHVTQGTIATNTDQLIRPTLEALAEENVLVVATTGGEAIENIKLDRIPENARIEKFIPYYNLLPHVDIIVTNGGYGGVQMALAHGIPLVAAGKSEDKLEICARIEWSGVGINLKTNTPTPIQIKNAVKQIVVSSNYRDKAKLIQNKMKSLDAPNIAVNLLSKLAATKQPILREN